MHSEDLNFLHLKWLDERIVGDSDLLVFQFAVVVVVGVVVVLVVTTVDAVAVTTNYCS